MAGLLRPRRRNGWWGSAPLGKVQLSFWSGVLVCWPFTIPPLSAQNVIESARIQVGPNHRASPADSAERNEGWISVGTTDPHTLIAASHKAPGCGAMLSRDGGQIWENLQLPKLNDCFDPMTASSDDGVFYLLSTGRVIPDSLVSQRRSQAPIRIYSSIDGGKTWRQPAELRTPVRPDHPRMVVDQSTGSHRGRVYVAWNEVSDTWLKNYYSVFLHFSDDSGRTFSEPILIESARGGKLVTTEPVVLSDGTLLVTYYQYFQPLSSSKNERQPFYIVRSSDGGQSFGAPEKVLEVGASAWNHLRTDFGRAFTLPIIVADISTHSRFRDRLYVVWDDVSTGESNIWMTHSSDQGRTWSSKVRVNDNAPGASNSPPDFRMTPVVAVNPDGVVGVAWYDRRDDAARRCWKQYFTASLDGGVTFLPNVAVSTVPSCPGRSAAPRVVVRQTTTDTVLAPLETIDSLVSAGLFAEADRLSIAHALRGRTPSGPAEFRLTFNADRNVWPGHYSGLAADTTGAFHALWADRRDGLQYMYSARIDVEQGNPALPSLRERTVTDLVQLIPERTKFDESSGTSEVVLRIRNASARRLYAPLRLRVVRITSPGGAETTRMLNATSGGAGQGATWDLSELMGTRRRLDPDMVTEEFTIRLQSSTAVGLDASFQFEVTGRVAPEGSGDPGTPENATARPQPGR